jgi:hypothetical protein
MPELIDRLSLIDKLDQGQKKALDVKDFTSFYALVYFKAILQEAPTIDAEPVRYANAIYIPNSKGYPSCSYCHEEMPFFLNFCPCCGAKMREGGADNAAD